MAPPAKRQRRNTIQESDDEFERSPSNNTLANFLSTSPSPKKDSRTTATTFESPTRSNRSDASQPIRIPSRVRRGHTQRNGTSPNAKKSKDVSKKDASGQGTDLRSLFSRQEQKGVKPVRRTAPALEEEIISDPISEDDEISEVKVSSASLVSQHARKRLKTGLQSSAEEPPRASQFLKPPKPAGAQVPDNDARPWSERFAPKTLAELAVHKKKVSDVRQWLEDVIAGRLRQRVLLLKGPAGSGKTATLRLLAEALGSELLEWRNPTGNKGSGLGFVSASAQFDEFLGRGGKFGTLDTDEQAPSVPATPSTSNARRIIIIEEFPNTFSRSSSVLNSFRGSVLQYLHSQTPSLAGFTRSRPPGPVTPVVMIISETLLTTTSASADSFTAHRLLGPEILRHPGLGIIEFNAVAPTILFKALEMVVLKEARKSGRRRTPGPSVLKHLGEIGDIRSAISSLEFLCLKGDNEADWGAKVAFTKSKKGAKEGVDLTKSEAESLEMVSQREASLGIFHAVGKVVYNKREETPSTGSVEEFSPIFSHRARPKRSLVAVEGLIDETGTDTHTFISALHENYVLSCESTGSMDLATSMDYVNDCLDHLSLSDILSASPDAFFGGGSRFGAQQSGSHLLRQDDITFEVAVRGLLFSLPNPVRRATGYKTRGGGDTFKMFYPQSLKLWREKEEIQGLVDVLSTKLLMGEDEQSTKPFTEGAMAFRAAKQTFSAAGRERKSMDQRQSTAAVASKSASDETPTMLSLGNVAPREMLLERLPYMSQIARARKTTLRLRDLEKITSFSSTQPHASLNNNDDHDHEGNDDGEEEMGLAGETWATDRPSEEQSPRTKRAGLGAGTMSGILAHKLVLSDDDIED